MSKVLVVEDNPDIRSLLLVQIKWMGFTPITASTGKEALEIATSEKPDLILMDFLMPGMDGWEATRMLRSNPETKDIPILATTALSRPADLKSCIDAGCNDYIVKPFSVLDLQKKISELLVGAAV
jgi:two-component system, cell cycle response regulator DivK